MWTRTPTIIADRTAPDDWTILCAGQRVGRVYASRSPAGVVVWRWAAWGQPARTGEADSLDAACEAVRGAV